MPSTLARNANVARHISTRRRSGGIPSYAAAPIVGLAKGLMLLSANLPKLIHAFPSPGSHRKFPTPQHHQNTPAHNRLAAHEHFPAKPIDQAGFWVNAAVAVALVLLGGLFAGLTLGLMGQDEIYLQVIEQSGEGAERIHAKRVLGLLKKGKHWVLVTLLLSNVITNETLPIVLDRSLGGGWPAVATSTVLIVIFGEIIPQSVCVRYGLAIGSHLSPFVLGLMYLLYPIGKPTAMLLDYILGQDHGTVYKKAGLKTLVTLHKTLGTSPADRLNQDEVTIISAVLDLKDKPVVSIMTPIKDVFTMSTEDVLDEETMDEILGAGYSRIPIHAPGEPTNFVGMLLVKILITYDPEDEMKVKDFPLATLPETAPDTSCLDIVNFFQEGKSHMVLVSSSPGENFGALGVVTLEDVIEELIGEEIIDESDVYIDVHKAIRRINPFPFAFTHKNHGHSSHPRMAADTALATSAVAAAVAGLDTSNAMEYIQNQNSTDYLTTHSYPGTHATSINALNNNVDSSPLIAEIDQGTCGTQRHSGEARRTAIQLPPDVMAHLKHLGPSNLASNPKKTVSKTIKIKHGSVDDGIMKQSTRLNRSDSTASNRPGSRGYGALINTENGPGEMTAEDTSPLIAFNEIPSEAQSSHVVENPRHDRRPNSQHEQDDSVPVLTRVARSGSLVEKRKTSGGVPKTVIETTSSEEDGEAANGGYNGGFVDGKGKENLKGETSPLLKGWGR